MNIEMFYLLLSMVFLLFYCGDVLESYNFILCFCLIILYASYFFSIPDYILSGDTGRYARAFSYVATLSFNKLSYFVTNVSWSYSFCFLLWLIGQVYANQVFFYCVIFSIFLCLIFKSIKELFSLRDTVMLNFCYVLYPIFFNYFASGIRQGLGMVLMLYGIIKWSKDKKMQALLLLSLSLLWHYGMLGPYLVLIPFLLLKSKTRLYSITVIIYLFMLGLYCLGGNLSSIIGSHVNNYYSIYFRETSVAWMNSLTSYKTGFRLDFLLFSLLPLFVYQFLKKLISEENAEKVKFFLSVYMLLNMVYLVMAFVLYADRFAAFSWFIMPLVVYEVCIATNLKNIKKYFAVSWLTFNFILVFYFYRSFLF